MKTAAISELKNRLSHFLRLVAKGETVTVLDRGKPIARISRIESGDAELESLIASGMARAPVKPLSKSFFTRPRPRSRASLVDALLEDRADRF
ncbi:MAG TPA: type II toxin-antitoxin system prevent-host-death family antitoxin [Candidatus Binatia bacterium]